MVEVTPDVKAYQAFVKRLEETLKKIAITQDRVILKAVNRQVRNSKGEMVDGPDEFLLVEDASSLSGLKTSSTKQGDQIWGVWVCSITSGNHKTQTWNGYVLPGDPKKCFIPLLMPEASSDSAQSDSKVIIDAFDNKPEVRISGSKTNLRIVLLDKEGETVTEDLRELTIMNPRYSSDDDVRGNHRRPLLRSGIFPFAERNGFEYADYNNLVRMESNERFKKFNGLIAPFFFYPSKYNSKLFCSTKRIVEFRLKVTEEELRRFDAAKVEISFSE
jgi:hypothetical protein